MKVRARLEPGSRGVTSITFSPDSSMVACIDATDDQNCCIFRARDGKQIHKFKTDGQKKLDIAWGKTPHEGVIGIAGKRSVKFIISHKDKFDNSKVATGIIKAAYRTDYASIDFMDDGCCLVGTRKGKIYKLSHTSQTYNFDKSMKAHKKTVNCITVLSQCILSGGNDNKVIVWSHKFKKLHIFEADSSIRSLDYMGSSLLYSTSKGTIAKRIITLENNKAVAKPNSEEIIMRSHNSGEAWGLAIYKHYIYSCGDDNQLLVWNMKTRQVDEAYTLWTKETESKDGVRAKLKRNYAKKKMTASTLSKLDPPYQARALAVSHKEKHLAVAFNDTKVVIKSLYSLDSYLHVLYDCNEWAECLEYNPDETRLAVGSHDNRIYVYDITDTGYVLFATLKGHSSYITAIDWSADGSYIRSNCGAYELLFFNVDSKEQDTSGASNTRNTEWATQNCKLAWNVQGIYPHGTDGSHVNGVAALKSRNLLATGDDYGLVNLYHDPCLEEYNKARSYRGHSEHVVRIKFSPDGKYMVSNGGYDQTIIQWKRDGEETDEDTESEDEEEDKRQADHNQEYANLTEDDTDSDEEVEKKSKPSKSNHDESAQQELSDEEEEVKGVDIKPKKQQESKNDTLNLNNSHAPSSKHDGEPFNASADPISPPKNEDTSDDEIE